MSYQSGTGVVLPMVHPLGPWGVHTAASAISASAPSSAALTASTALFFPVLVPTTCVVRRLWWANGSTVSASYNIAVGVYADARGKPGTQLVATGNTAQGTASQVQFVDVTDTTLAPGLYWLAIWSSSGSATCFRTSWSGSYNANGAFQEANAGGLQNPATPIEAAFLAIFVFGFATTASP